MHVSLFLLFFPLLCPYNVQRSRTNEWKIFRPDVSKVSAEQSSSNWGTASSEWAFLHFEIRLWNEAQCDIISVFTTWRNVPWTSSNVGKLDWPVSTPWRCHRRASSRSPGSWDASVQGTSWSYTGRRRWSGLRKSPLTPYPAAPCRQKLQRTEKFH